MIPETRERAFARGLFWILIVLMPCQFVVRRLASESFPTFSMPAFRAYKPGLTRTWREVDVILVMSSGERRTIKTGELFPVRTTSGANLVRGFIEATYQMGMKSGGRARARFNAFIERSPLPGHVRATLNDHRTAPTEEMIRWLRSEVREQFPDLRIREIQFRWIALESHEPYRPSEIVRTPGPAVVIRLED